VRVVHEHRDPITGPLGRRRGSATHARSAPPADIGRLGPVSHEIAEPHPFRRVIGVDQGHLARVGGLDLGQRISALRSPLSALRSPLSAASASASVASSSACAIRPASAVTVFAESTDVFDVASRVITSAELLPGEDPELLGRPNRVSFYRLVHADLPITEGSPA
jgi:hypothetical protein